MATDTNSSKVNKFLAPTPSSITAFDKYLVPTCDDYGHEIGDSSVLKNTPKPDEES